VVATEWIGESSLVPSDLGPAPLFGLSGESPPLRTEPVVVARALITSGPQLTELEIAANLRFAEGFSNVTRAISHLPTPPPSFPLPRISGRPRPIADEPAWPDTLPEPYKTYAATKRIVYRQSWQRDDPITQLVPGETYTKSIQLTTGLTDQVLMEFSSSLGIGGKVSAVQLSAQLSQHLSRTVTISSELQATITRQFTNTLEGVLRRVAIWYVVHSISLYRIGHHDGDKFKWVQFDSIEFADASVSQSTYCNVPV
jgi:hypothetical protein